MTLGILDLNSLIKILSRGPHAILKKKREKRRIKNTTIKKKGDISGIYKKRDI